MPTRNGLKCRCSPMGAVAVEDGFAIPLINQTGGVSVKGTVVEASPSTDDAVILADVSSDHPCGIVYQAGIPVGERMLVIVSGIAEVLLKDGTACTHGNWLQTSDVSGRADATLSAPPGGGSVVHWNEMGHCLESKIAGTNVLARCVLHFN